VSEAKGRYNDQSDFKFMANAGIWFENFSLPAVINECLMQGYDGCIKLFPNWPKNIDARFDKLRSAGAFLVSAIQKAGKVTEVKIVSEKGNKLHISVPWGASGNVITASGKTKIENEELVLQTTPGEVLILRP
jgi:alpha-L-fucosidase 2